MNPSESKLPSAGGRLTDVTASRSKPHSEWVCGYAELGKCCASGPTADGRCGHLVGSKDESSEEVRPCIPRRGHRWRRDALKVNLAILVGGLVLLMMALPGREDVFVPGELSSKHAQILNNTLVSERCSVCHPTVHNGKVQLNIDATENQSWFTQVAIQTAQSLVENDGRQDRLCMQCHQSHMPAASMRLAHDMDSEMWARLREADADPAWQLVSTSTSRPADQPDNMAETRQTSCAMCHVEHHGRQFDLKLISDSRCQACHQRQFESLTSGHPEFTNFPIDRPRSLMFSHARHQGEHFTKKNREFDCKACHVDANNGGAYGIVTRSLSFETACASCHDTAIRAASTEGWALLQIPSLESNAISSQPEFNAWPATARYGYDGEVSPVLWALLLSDPDLTQTMQMVPASGKIVDISTISDRRSKVTQQIAAATKRLIDETARDGQAAWTRRLELVTKERIGRELSGAEQALIGRMCAGLPPDLFRQMQSEWFKSESPVGTPVSTTQQSPRELDGSAGESGQSQTGGQTGEQPSEDSLLIDEASTSEMAGDLLLDASQDLSIENQHSAAESVRPGPIKGATHVAGGGWYLDASTVTVRYLPTGHADTLQSAWAQWWSLVEDDFKKTAPIASYEQAPIAQAARIPGDCVQCHQLANRQLGPEAFRIVQRSRAAKEFTKFNHTPHLSLPAVNDCRFCHQPHANQAPVSIPAGNDRLVSLKPLQAYPQTHSEFASIKVHQCASCHRQGGAGDGCLQCHNYHISDGTAPGDSALRR